jgi:hypothetical protein
LNQEVSKNRPAGLRGREVKGTILMIHKTHSYDRIKEGEVLISQLFDDKNARAHFSNIRRE